MAETGSAATCKSKNIKINSCSNLASFRKNAAVIWARFLSSTQQLVTLSSHSGGEMLKKQLFWLIDMHIRLACSHFLFVCACFLTKINKSSRTITSPSFFFSLTAFCKPYSLLWQISVLVRSVWVQTLHSFRESEEEVLKLNSSSLTYSWSVHFHLHQNVWDNLTFILINNLIFIWCM